MPPDTSGLGLSRELHRIGPAVTEAKPPSMPELRPEDRSYLARGDLPKRHLLVGFSQGGHATVSMWARCRAIHLRAEAGIAGP